MALRNLTYYGEVTPLDQIEQNIVWYLRDELIKAGGYYNITSGFLGYNGENLSLLRPSYQVEHSNFQFWTGLSHQWVWESGVVDTDYDGTVNVNTANLAAPPIAVSGIYMSGVFYPTIGTTGPMAHYIDYNRGGVVFDSARTSGANIWCDRTERAAFVYPMRSDEYKKIVYDHLRVIDQFPGSGIDIIPPEDRALLPAIFVGARQINSQAYELGKNTNWTTFQIYFGIFAENIYDFNRLRDVCAGLEGTNIVLFDLNTASGNYPLDYLGRLRSEVQTRNELLNDLTNVWRKGYFKNGALDQPEPSVLPLHTSIVVVDFELLL